MLGQNGRRFANNFVKGIYIGLTFQRILSTNLMNAILCVVKFKVDKPSSHILHIVVVCDSLRSSERVKCFINGSSNDLSLELENLQLHDDVIKSAFLALCEGNSPVNGEFPTQRPVTRSFDVFFDLCLNKRLSKQSWGWWFETPLRSLWRHCNVTNTELLPVGCVWKTFLGILTKTQLTVNELYPKSHLRNGGM